MAERDTAELLGTAGWGKVAQLEVVQVCSNMGMAGPGPEAEPGREAAGWEQVVVAELVSQ